MTTSKTITYKVYDLNNTDEDASTLVDIVYIEEDNIERFDALLDDAIENEYTVTKWNENGCSEFIVENGEIIK